MFAVHAFLYLWYGIPLIDGNWSHWDHSILPHWSEHIRTQYPGEETRWIPPHDIHAPFYPARGLYSSKDRSVITSQLQEMKSHGMDAAVVSWWGRPGMSKGDSQGKLTDDAVAMVMDAAALVGGIGVALHLEPYEGRNVESIRADLEHLHRSFGTHPGLARDGGLPIFYVYDSYHLSPQQWQRLLTKEGDLSVRGGPLDGVFLGLWLEAGHGRELAQSGFDGGYTYFAADGFSYGSTTQNWPRMAQEARELGLRFVPSVGPGYDDSRIRPWNQAQIRDRQGGDYYQRMWQAALSTQPQWVSITSFNEWGEGTQIEGAVPRTIDVEGLSALGQALPMKIRKEGLKLRVLEAYQDYSPGGQDLYMDMTASFSRELKGRESVPEL